MTSMLEQGQKVVRGELPPPPIARLLGFVVKCIEPGHAVFEMEADERHHNPMGTLHGGEAARRRLLRPGGRGDGVRVRRYAGGRRH